LAANPSPTERTVPFAALREGDFRLFYAGVVCSNFGTNFTQIAMSWQIYQMTGSPLQLGLLGLVRAIPAMTLVLFGGLLADAVDRRRLMMITQGCQFCVTGALLVLSVLGLLSPGVFYVTSALQAVFSSLENPARQAIVPNLVPKHLLTNALALNATQRSAANIAGPPLAGIVLGFFGPTVNYAIDTLSWLVMIAMLAVIHPAARQGAGRRALTFQALGDGFLYVWTHPILLSMMLLDFAQNFLGQARGLLPVYASDILQAGPQGYGILSAATSIGTLSTGAVMSGLPQMRRAGLGVLVGILIFAVCTCVFAYSQVFWLSALMLAGQGMGDCISHVFRLTILQSNIPDEIRGRVTGVNSLFTNGGGPLGQFRSGAMAQWIGPQASMLVGGLAVLGVIGCVATLPLVRKFELLPSRDSTVAGPAAS
jgi:MFS family permease